MQLRAWLTRENLTAAEFARRSGIGHRQLVFRYLHGIAFPSPDKLLLIRQATAGSVTADDFVDQHASTRAVEVQHSGVA